MTCGMASASYGGTPSVRDVRRARATRFSISPAQEFGSPSFSLGLEKSPQPPTFDDCCDKDFHKRGEKQSSKLIRLLNNIAPPPISLAVDDIQAPLTFEDCKQKEGLRQGKETRGQFFLFRAGGNDTSTLSESNGCLGTDTLKTAEERRNNEGRASKVFSSPSFSLGLEKSNILPDFDDVHSWKEKQAVDLTLVHGNSSIYPSSNPLREELPSSSKSRMLHISREDRTEVPKSTLLQDSPSKNSGSLKCGVTSKRSAEVTSRHRKFHGNISPPVPSLFGQRVERSPTSNPSVQSSEEHTPNQILRSEGLSPRRKLSRHVKTEPASHCDVTRRANDQEILRKRFRLENKSRATKEISLTFESLSRSREDQTPERRPDKDGPSSLPGAEKQSPELKGEGSMNNRVSSNEGARKFNKLLEQTQEIKAIDLTKYATKVSSDLQVGLIRNKEEGQENQVKIGERMLLGEERVSSFSHSLSPSLIDLSQVRKEEPFLGQLKWREGVSKDSQSTGKYEILLGDTGDSKMNGLQIKGEKVDVVDVSTHSLRLAAKQPLRKSYGCYDSKVVEVSEDELEFGHVTKWRRLSKPCFQVKAEPMSTNGLIDLTSLPEDSTSAGDERTPGTPVVEQKKTLKRLRRGSSSAFKNSAVSQARQDSIDRCVAMRKVRMKPSDTSLEPNKQVQTFANYSAEQMTDSSQQTKEDEYIEDIEDFSEYELPSAGSRPHRDRRSLQTQIQLKKLSVSARSPAGLKKPVLYIPGLDADVVSKKRGEDKDESVTCLESKIASSNVAEKLDNIKAELITLSDDEELWGGRSKVLPSQTLPLEDVKVSTIMFEKQKRALDHERAGAGPHVERGSSWKGKAPSTDGSDLWKSYAEDFSRYDSSGSEVEVARASNSVYKMCQSEDFRVADFLRERLPHFKPIGALLLDGGLDQEPVYINYRNQFGRSQGMDCTSFAELDCTQPQLRRKHKRSSSKRTKGTKAFASSSITVSSQRTTTIKSPAKGRRKAWTLFRGTKGRASASGSTPGRGFWIVENGRRVYVQDGQTLTGRAAYAAYKKVGN